MRHRSGHWITLHAEHELLAAVRRGAVMCGPGSADSGTLGCGDALEPEPVPMRAQTQRHLRWLAPRLTAVRELALVDWVRPRQRRLVRFPAFAMHWLLHATPSAGAAAHSHSLLQAGAVSLQLLRRVRAPVRQHADATAGTATTLTLVSRNTLPRPATPTLICADFPRCRRSPPTRSRACCWAWQMRYRAAPSWGRCGSTACSARGLAWSPPCPLRSHGEELHMLMFPWWPRLPV